MSVKMTKSINRVDRSIGVLKNADSAPDNDLVKAPPEVLIGFMWELTKEAYSLRGNFDAEQRLQRNITNLIRP
jgi:hypothetical protein